MKIPKFNYNLKTTSEAQDKPQPIILWLTLEAGRIKKYIGKSIAPENWNFENKRAFVDKNLSERKQRELRKINNLLDYVEEFVGHDIQINELLRATGTFTNERTIKHHQIILKRFCDFLTYKRKPDNFSIFNSGFEKEFTEWALGVKKYRINTVPATFSVMKVWLKQAEKQNLLQDDSFHRWRSKGTEVDNIYLTEEEIERLYHLDIPALKEDGKIDTKSRCEETRDLFIIACYTGLRLSDWEKLNSAIWNIEKRLVTIFTQKTKKEVVLPLNETLIALYNKYNGRFPHSVDKTHSLAQLRELGRLAGINDEVLISENIGGQIETKKYLKYQQIMNHTARRSFATNMFLKGIPTLIIMKMTGHKTEENFLKYIKITKEQAALKALSIMDKLNQLNDIERKE